MKEVGFRMASELISGPAGGGKSQVVRQRLADNPGSIAVDFQSIYRALTQDVRDPDTGLYPMRDPNLLPITEFSRRAVLSAARSRGLQVFATNSDGSPERRAFLLAELGEGATETVVDPGRDVVRARLSDSVTGELSGVCDGAIERWFGNL